MREPKKGTFPERGYSPHRGHDYTTTEHPDDPDINVVTCSCGAEWRVNHDPDGNLGSDDE